MTNDLPDWTRVVARPADQLSGSPWSYGTGGASKTFTLSSDCHAIGLLLPGYQSISSLTVVGATSGVQYVAADFSFTNYGGAQWIPVQPAVDSQVIVSITAGIAGTAYVSQIHDPSAVAVVEQFPAPWTTPNRHPASIKFANPGQNNSVNILAAPGTNLRIFLHCLQWMWETANTAAGGFWEDTNGGTRGGDSAAQAGASRTLNLNGAELPPNTGLQWTQTGTLAAGTIFCYGSVVYGIG